MLASTTLAKVKGLAMSHQFPFLGQEPVFTELATSTNALSTPWSERLRALDPANHEYAIQFVDVLLNAAHHLGASDIHVQPTAEGLQVRLRLDGVLASLGVFPQGDTGHVVSRLKVLAELLTYRSDIPQEGRLRLTDFPHEVRLSTIPTVWGERAALRFFMETGRLFALAELGLPVDLFQDLSKACEATQGLLLITGPAGAGKTTTTYAMLDYIQRQSSAQRNIMTMEDPVEAIIPGISQSQVSGQPGWDLNAGIRALLRQDPDVLMVGEIRDPQTAGLALQAALTGQLVLATFHSGDCLEALQRLSELGAEPYAVRAGVRGVLAQRLVRALCACSQWCDHPEQRLGFGVDRVKLPVGCEHCHGTGYKGRRLLAEWMPPTPEDFQLAEQGGKAHAQRNTAGDRMGRILLRDQATQAVQTGWTSPAEIRRVLGV